MNVIKRYTGIGGGVQVPNKLIIHAMGEYIRVNQSFENKGQTIEAGVYTAHEWLTILGLSCHFLIHPNGDVTKQRSTKEMCWHAKGYNTNSVGIEVLVEGEWDYASFIDRIKEDWVKEEQYDTLIELSEDIIEFFEINKNSVVRHSDLSPDRKEDPGSGFKWDWFKGELI